MKYVNDQAVRVLSCISAMNPTICQENLFVWDHAKGGLLLALASLISLACQR